jgi:ABC-type Fe3+-hydroxamate transport system substrate-binding protein
MIPADSGAQDDTGASVRVPPQVHRVVSLVPSLTEAVAATARPLLVGGTKYCTHPGDLQVTRVGGTKNPDVETVVALRPDLVLAAAEENRPSDLDALRVAGVPVWVTDIRSVPAAFPSLARMLAACGLARPRWLAHAADRWAGLRRYGERPDFQPVDVVVPIWRRPWMALGGDTFASDLLARLGLRNLLDGAADRYPRLTLEELHALRPQLVVLPDEPYAFGPSDGPEAFTGLRVALVSGRHLTWYGPSLLEAPDVLSNQLGIASSPDRG